MITNIISDIQGAYEWGKRDCLVLAGRVASAKFTDYAEQIQNRVNEYHVLSEARAMLKIVDQDGGVFNGIVNELKAILPLNSFEVKPVKALSMNETLSPGNLIELPVSYGGLGRFGVVGEDCFVWSWEYWRIGPLQDFNIGDEAAASCHVLRWT